MEIENDGPAAHAIAPMVDKRGREHLVVIVKYTFAVDAFGRVELIPDGPAPRFADEYCGDDAAKSSIRRPSELFDDKPGTDVILVGHAHPPPRRSAASVDVSLRVGPIAKTVRAFGLRVWQRGGASGVVPGPARSIREPIPLVYELAWGGMDTTDPERPLGEPRNYVGRGVTRNPGMLLDRPAAQLEHPDHPIGGPDPVPACFGAIHRHWQPRVSFAGTYDAAWEQTKMPLLPDDFDPRFNVCIPHDQWSPAPLRGDEPVEVLGATPEGAWRFALPRVAPAFASEAGGERREHRTHLDTMLIDADAMCVELTFRAAVPLPRKYELLEGVRVFEKTLLGRGPSGTHAAGPA